MVIALLWILAFVPFVLFSRVITLHYHAQYDQSQCNIVVTLASMYPI